MKVYTCTAFRGHWPVGTSAIIVAPDAMVAKLALQTALASNGLPQVVNIALLVEVDTTQPRVMLLQTGDY